MCACRIIIVDTRLVVCVCVYLCLGICLCIDDFAFVANSLSSSLFRFYRFLSWKKFHFNFSVKSFGWCVQIKIKENKQNAAHTSIFFFFLSFIPFVILTYKNNRIPYLKHFHNLTVVLEKSFFFLFARYEIIVFHLLNRSQTEWLTHKSIHIVSNHFQMDQFLLSFIIINNFEFSLSDSLSLKYYDDILYSFLKDFIWIVDFVDIYVFFFWIFFFLFILETDSPPITVKSMAIHKLIDVLCNIPFARRSIFHYPLMLPENNSASV